MGFVILAFAFFGVVVLGASGACWFRVRTVSCGVLGVQFLASRASSDFDGEFLDPDLFAAEAESLRDCGVGEFRVVE